MTTEADNAKRELEADQTEEPAAKRTKTDAEPEAAAEQQEAKAEADAPVADTADAAGDADAADDAAGEADDAGDGEAAAAASSEPIKLGYRTFKTGSEASDYFSEILKKSKPGDRLNEVIHTTATTSAAALDLLQQQLASDLPASSQRHDGHSYSCLQTPEYEPPCYVTRAAATASNELQCSMLHWHLVVGHGLFAYFCAS